MTQKILPLLFVLIAAFFLYTYKLSFIPNGLYVDEAVTGYNAYSILKTGSDEYGKSYPFAFRFFGSYSPPLYTYLSISFIYFLDLNIFSIRISSALLGVLSVGLIYIFLKNLDLIKNKKVIPLICVVLFMITPWNFFYSRIGYEIYLGAFLFFLSTLLIYLGFKKRIFLTLGIIVLSLSTYGAHTEIYLAPLFFIFLLIFFWKDIIKGRRYLIWGVVLGSVIQIPHLLILNTQAFINKNSLFYINDILIHTADLQKILPYPIALLLSFLREFLARFMTYFSPYSLFFSPDSDPQRSLPGLSVFYFWMVVPYLIGFYFLLKKIFTQNGKYIFLLAVLSATAPALTGDPFSTQRALPLLFPLFLICCLGIDYIYQKFNRNIFLVFCVFLFIISLVLLWRSYFVLFSSERAKVWGYGNQQLSNFITSNPSESFLIDQSRLKPLYIILAFYQQIDPKIIQFAADTRVRQDYYNNSSFNDEYQFKNINIKRLNFYEDIYKEVILIGDEFSISKDQAEEHFLTPVLEIKDPVGSIIFRGFKTNPLKKCQATNNYSPYCK